MVQITCSSKGSSAPAIAVFFCFFLLSLFLSAPDLSACGWWGDGGFDDDEAVIEVDDNGDLFPQVESPEILTIIGNFYRRGVGVEEDHVKAVYWYRKAAEMGFAGAQNNLAAMYEAGLGVTKDIQKAAQWFTKAAEQNEPYAQHSIGRMYLLGRGVTRDYQKAALWILRAADLGHHAAFRHASDLYRDGLGVPKNAVYAYKWLRIAALHGDKESEKLSREAAAGMEQPDLKAAENLIRQWMRKE